MGKYKQANPLKYFIAKYFFLVLALLQWFISSLIFFRYNQTLKNQYVALYFFTLGAIMFVVFLIIRDKVKRVALSKKKIVVINPGKKQKINWDEVSSLKLIPFINMYRLKQKGKKKGIYFFPSKNIDPLYGLIAKQSPMMEDLMKNIKS